MYQYCGPRRRKIVIVGQKKTPACLIMRHDSRSTFRLPNFEFYKRNKNIIKDEFEMIRKDDMDPPMVSFMPEMSHTSNILLQEQQVR